MAETVFERETKNMTPQEVYESTQREFRRYMETHDTTWQAEMLAGTCLPWSIDSFGAFKTFWFNRIPVALRCARG